MKIVSGRPAYLVPGQPQTEDINLAVYLQYPILSGNPGQANSLLKHSFVHNVRYHKSVVF